MKTTLKIFKYLLLVLLALIIIGIIYFYSSYAIQSSRNMAKLGPEAAALIIEGQSFRDLNKNEKLDLYEDSRQSIEARVENILSQMSIEEKAGMMFINMIAMNEDGSLMERPSPANPFTFASPTNSDLIANRLMNHFNILQIPAPKVMAEWHNKFQKLAERTRLGIPVTIASDPRHSFSENVGANLLAGAFSEWCEPIGLAATRDTQLVRQFGDIARQEYLATGIRLALHPMADLATEPRWARINGTFGEDAELSAMMLRAYIRGFQGDSLGVESVACMSKHFSGGGPQKDGLDAHFPYGKEQAYPGNNFDYHLIPFEKGVFEAGFAQIMPYYGIPVGQTSEDVGFAFNKEIITGLLRNKYGFDGVICSDWSNLTDKKMMGRVFLEATGWGVEELTPIERVEKALNAGIDQFGGENAPELVVELVESGKISESRIDESIRRLLRDKFKLGLFDNPYLDIKQVEKIVGKAEFRKAGELSQRKSLVLLKNEETAAGKVLPLKEKIKIYIENIDHEIASKYATVVDSLSDADFAILRLKTPFVPRGGMFESFFHQGDLDFKEPEKTRILNILGKVPTVVDIYLDRAAVIPEIAEKSAGLVANFGARDEAVLDLLFGKFEPSGKLPFELPSSMEAVVKQKEDVPYDSENPTFEFGHGLSYRPDSLLVIE